MDLQRIRQHLHEFLVEGSTNRTSLDQLRRQHEHQRNEWVQKCEQDERKWKEWQQNKDREIGLLQVCSFVEIF